MTADAGQAHSPEMSPATEPADPGEHDVIPVIPPGNRIRFGLLGVVAAFVIVADQLTKIWAVAELDGGRNIDLFWTLRLNLIRNTGSAFGLGSQFGQWLPILVSGVVVAILTYARRVQDRRMIALFGLIVGGALGNLVDRLIRADDGFLSGGVIDFVDFQWWPVFNVADMAVVTGAIGLMLISMRRTP